MQSILRNIRKKISNKSNRHIIDKYNKLINDNYDFIILNEIKENLINDTLIHKKSSYYLMNITNSTEIEILFVKINTKIDTINHLMKS